jgi:hypothetical protein
MTITLALALVGLTLIVVRGTIFRPIRRIWPALLECCQCTGMWVGMAAGAMGLSQEGGGRVAGAVLIGGATSLLAMLTDAVLLKLLGEPEPEKTA